MDGNDVDGDVGISLSVPDKERPSGDRYPLEPGLRSAVMRACSACPTARGDPGIPGMPRAWSGLARRL